MNWFRRRLLAVCVALLCVGPGVASAAIKLDLDGVWQFRIDPESAAATYDPSSRLGDPAWMAGMRAVDVPNTWAIGPDHAFHGVGLYKRNFLVSRDLVGRHVELNFGAVFSISRVWVNGVEVGQHAGGFTAFSLDISRVVRAGENSIVVAADDRPSFATVPGYAMRLRASGSVAYDWQPNGGLVRDVWLTVTDGGMIRRQVLTSVISTGQALVTDTATVDNVTAVERTYHLAATAIDPDGRIVATAQSRLTLSPKGQGRASLQLPIANPKLWNVGAAQLYRIRLVLEDEAGRPLDTHQDSYGLRTIVIRDRRLLVNGQPVRLTGVSRHEDSPWEGLAETRGTIEKDWDDLAALHTTLTRPIHYPQPPAVFDAADRAGILLIPEIPVWQMSEAQLRDPRLIAAAQAMMAEMIEQARNHPSVMAWSICNESDASTPGGEAYVKAMKALINRLDPGRFVSFADADIATVKPGQREAVMDDVDFIMANAYFGTWSGGAAAVEPWLDHMDKAYPDKLVVVSEFGWPGPFSKDTSAADRDRVDNLRSQLAAFDHRSFIGGAIFWTYQDYRSSRNLWPGETDGYVDHGLVDQNRQRRPSYFAWEEATRPLSAVANWRMGPNGPVGFAASIVPNTPGRLPSYPQIGVHARWRVVDTNGKIVEVGEAPLDFTHNAVTPGVELERHWAAVSTPVRLQLDILDLQGVRLGGATLDYRPLIFGFAPAPPDARALPDSRDNP